MHGLRTWRHAGWALALVAGCTSPAPPTATAPSPEEGEAPAAPVARVVCDPSDVQEVAQMPFDVSPGGTPEVSPAFVAEHRCGVRLIDVRELEELTGSLGHIEGIEAIPQRHVLSEAMSWDRDQAIVLVDRSGRRSGVLARQLRDVGFTKVASMTGGMLEWNQVGYPVERGELTAVPNRFEEPAGPMRQVTAEDVRGHIADRDQVRWTKAATLMLHGTQACVDGRDAHAIIGTPGGDAGELVLALAAAESVLGRSLTTEQIEDLFHRYLDAFGHFYMHTDEHAVAALIDALEDEHPDARLPDPNDLAAAEAFLRNPPPELREDLLDLVVDPRFVGCGHLRLMLQHSDEYRVRPELEASVIRAFYRHLWEKHPALDFVVLEGGHLESAVVTVTLDKEVHPYTRIPLVSPRLEDTEIFVNHPQVAAFVREQNVAFILEEMPLLRQGGIDESRYFDELATLADRQLAATVGHLAAGLPQYEVRFVGEEFEVLGPK